MNEVSRMLQAIQDGDPTSAEDLLPLVYDQLRRLAAWQMSRESPGQTLQPALVHEAWLRLVGTGDPPWEGRRHFLAAAAETMRRILIDIARHKQAARHGGGLRRTELDDLSLAASAPDEELLAAHEALDVLASDHQSTRAGGSATHLPALPAEGAGRPVCVRQRSGRRPGTLPQRGTSGLWLRVPLVLFTTGMVVLGYGVLLVDASRRGALHAPSHWHLIALVVVILTGLSVAYLVHRVSAQTGLYERRPHAQR